MKQLQHRSSSPDHFTSAPVLVRFLLRLVALSAFAIFGTPGFVASFSTLAIMAALFCSFLAAVRQEAIFGPVLTHWDEAAAYMVIGWIIRVI